MVNEISLQCNHKIIINMNKCCISKEIYPFLKGDKSLNENILEENFISLDVENLFLNLEIIMKIIKDIEEEIQLFIFRKKENIVIGNNSESREVSYFRLILIEGEVSSYEDYDYEILFDINKFQKNLYEKLDRFREILSLPEAEKINVKNYDILFPPATGGYFIHETVGHLLESDNISIFNINDIIGCNMLSVVDDIEGNESLVGLNKYDDENVEIKKKELIKKGRVINFISPNNGFSRSENILEKSLPRMRVTYVENCNLFDYECHEKYKNYLKVAQIFGGGVDFRSGYYQLLIRGIIYERGIPTYRVENIILSGESKESLDRIVFIGKDLKIAHAYCVKNGQMLDVGVGSPTIYLKKSEEVPVDRNY